MSSINLKKNHSSFLNKYNPYPLLFNSYSSSQKSFITSILHNTAAQLSGNKPEQLYDYFLNNSYIGKSYFPISQNTLKAEQVLNNIKTMHSFVSTKYKSSILSLIAGLYSRTELKNFGFNFSNKQFNTAFKKFDNQIFNLSDYRRYIPPFKSKINKETFEFIIKFLLQNSRLSTSTCFPVKLSYSLENTTINYNLFIIYYLEK